MDDIEKTLAPQVTAAQEKAQADGEPVITVWDCFDRGGLRLTVDQSGIGWRGNCQSREKGIVVSGYDTPVAAASEAFRQWAGRFLPAS